MLKRRRSRHQSRKGQAMIEFLPSVAIFLMVLTASLSYFRVMRAAAIRQEVARNLVFAKIDNVGTLTTPINQFPNDRPGDLILGSDHTVTSSRNQTVQRSNNCFSVEPDSPNETRTVNALFLGVLQSVSIRSYAAIYRFPASRCP